MAGSPEVRGSFLPAGQPAWERRANASTSVRLAPFSSSRLLYLRPRAADTHVLVLEELGDAKEELSGLLDAERLPAIEEVHDPRQQGPALARRDGRLVEAPSLLDHRRLVVHCGRAWE